MTRSPKTSEDPGVVVTVYKNGSVRVGLYPSYERGGTVTPLQFKELASHDHSTVYLARLPFADGKADV